MKLPQIILVIGCLGLLLGLYFWGKTVPTKSKTAISATEQSSQKGDFDFEGYMLALKKSLTPGQQQYLIGLEIR